MNDSDDNMKELLTLILDTANSINMAKCARKMKAIDKEQAQQKALYMRKRQTIALAITKHFNTLIDCSKFR